MESITQWDPNKVHQWMCSIGFPGYEKQIKENGISGDLLVHLDHAALKDMSIWEVGKRLLILRAIYQLKVSYGIAIEPGDYVPPSVVFENEYSHQAASSLRAVEQALHEKDNTIQHLVRDVERMQREVNRLKDDLRSVQNDQKPLPEPDSGFHSVPSSPHSVVDRFRTNNETSEEARSGSPGVEGAAAIKVYGGQKPSSSSREQGADTFKSFRISLDDPCYKVLPAALKKYKINDDWRQYALFICYGNTERILTYNDKPLLLMKQLKENNESPVFILKHIKQMKSPAVSTPSAPTIQPPPRKSSDILNKDLPLPPEMSGGGSSSNQSAGSQQGLLGLNGAALHRSGTTASVRTSSKTANSTKIEKDKDKDKELSGTTLVPSNGSTSGGSLTPSNHSPSVSSSSTSNQPSKQESNAQETVEANETAVALYEWEAKLDDELNVKVGDVFTILSKGHGWWVVRRGENETGWIPASILAESNSADGYFSAEGVAISDFTKTGPNELSIKTGDKLRIFRRHQHWLLATCDGQRGWVPSWFVSLDSETKP
ncbi:Adaptor for signal transduction [Actinomortierella wolfii]|nr:Adaptor for signal transduction [Actinomortierella wolfii]